MNGNKVIFRLARRDDLPSIVRMLADDDLGSQRERYEEPLPKPYYGAFEKIKHDSNHELIVAELNGEVIGTLHLTFLPSIRECKKIISLMAYGNEDKWCNSIVGRQNDK